ncbi:MAG: hypothetical protein R3B84_22965 [Zavarzinella sp.]
MSPDAEAPGGVADEVGVEVADAEVVNRFDFATSRLRQTDTVDPPTGAGRRAAGTSRAPTPGTRHKTDARPWCG